MHRLVPLVATLVACASLAAYANATAPKLESVPGVVGMAEKPALEVLVARGFNIHVLLINNGEVRAGKVISQKPSTGRFVAGTTIDIDVSTGPKPH